MGTCKKRLLPLCLAALLLSASGCSLLRFRDISGDTETSPPDSASTETDAPETEAAPGAEGSITSHGPFIGYVADAETPWIELYTEVDGDYVARIPYEIFHDWIAADRTREGWTPGWINEYLPFYYAEFGEFRWAAAHLTDTVLGSGRKNVATSADGGETWEIGSTQDDYGGNHVVGMGFLSETLAFMSFDPDNEPPETSRPAISRTTDGGKTWERLTFAVPDELAGYKLKADVPFCEGDVLVYPVGVYIGYTLQREVYLVSRDSGLSWEWKTDGNQPPFPIQ